MRAQGRDWAITKKKEYSANLAALEEVGVLFSRKSNHRSCHLNDNVVLMDRIRS